MISMLRALSALISAVIIVGCASAPPSSSPGGGSPQPTQAAPATPAGPAPEPTQQQLGNVAMELSPGTWTWVSERPGVEFPPILFTVPDGWSIDGRFVRHLAVGGITPVAMQFWDVGEVYGHPCRWFGSLFDPGPSVADLTSALAEIPLRHATDAVEVTVDGYAGTHLEWSVPDDIDFADCDTDPGDGAHYFESWIGDQSGWGGDRYQQGPGQVDRIWILDVDGVRFVIDAFSMPTATAAEIEELLEVVGSLAFDD